MSQAPYKASAKLKDKVCQLVSTGMSEIDVAAAIGCSRSTLREHYAEQLQVGRALVRAEVRDMLMTKAREGNVSAMKYLDIQLNGNEPVGRAIGKKQQRQDAAETAGDAEWSGMLRVVSKD